MPIYKHLSTGKRFFCIHIPRTAGRFISENLLINDCRREHNDSWAMKNGVELSHYHREYYEKYLDVKDIPHFAVVRNPVDRFISAEGHIGIVDSDLKVDRKLLNYLIKGDGASKYYYHFRPQVEYISSKTHVWKYEDGIGKEFASWLSNILDIDFVFDDNIGYCKSERSERMTKTPHLVNIINKFYKKDFDQFYQNQKVGRFSAYF